jgi:hypothetical protein
VTDGKRVPRQFGDLADVAGVGAVGRVGIALAGRVQDAVHLADCGFAPGTDAFMHIAPNQHRVYAAS